MFANVMHATWFPWTLSGGFVPRTDDKLAHTTAQCRIIPVTSFDYISVAAGAMFSAFARESVVATETARR